MKKAIWMLIVVLMLFACKNRNKSPQSGEPIDSNDFAGFFKDIKLPFQLADSNVLQKPADTLTIPYTVFTSFVPDSVFSKAFGKGVKPVFHPLGKVVVKGGETYLLVRAATNARKMVYILAFDKDLHFSAAMPFMDAAATNISHSANFDSKYTITLLEQQKGSGNALIYHKDVYVYNTAGAFTLILTESNDASASQSHIINPIDTLPAKHKWSGDYMQDKKNFVSIRDGKTAGQLQVFIHFEKMDGSCNGELKGTVKINDASTALFTEASSPCEILFTFRGNTVIMKEQNGCGSHRDIKCFFEGSYTRKPTAANRKKTGKKK